MDIYDYDLSRFTTAHQRSFETALKEIRNGKKVSHWMWYIFPQIDGLGRSETAIHYAIKNEEEAIAFLYDPYLSNNLTEICEALLELECDDAYEIFGDPDDKKLRSSMTLFAHVSEDEGSIFHEVLEKFYDGQPDYRTLNILKGY